MSEYVDIKVNKLSLWSFRNYLDDFIVGLLFSPLDLSITDNCMEDPEDEDAELFTRYQYVTTVKHTRERLDAQGYTIKRFDSEMERSLLDSLD